MDSRAGMVDRIIKVMDRTRKTMDRAMKVADSSCQLNKLIQSF